MTVRHVYVPFFHAFNNQSARLLRGEQTGVKVLHNYCIIIT